MRPFTGLFVCLLFTASFSRGQEVGRPVVPAVQGCACCAGAKTHSTGEWLVHETTSFRIIVPSGSKGLRHLAGTCESLRRLLQVTWLGTEQPAWTPKCEIVVHPTVLEYRNLLGPGSAQSSGCTTIEIVDKQVKRRRIDLRADALDWLTAALPHELTHVVVADRFAHTSIPRWADEGMAILAESDAKREQRHRAMRASWSRRSGYTAEELIELRDYPDAARRDAFYGQSAALVACLVELDSSERFLKFLEAAAEQGYAAALAENYGKMSLGTLPVRWSARPGDGDGAAGIVAAQVNRLLERVD
jgi:hypothetical protein